MDFVGLDLGSYEFKAVELKETKKGQKELVAYDSAPAPPHFLTSDSEVDWAAYAKALEKFYTEADFTTRQVVSALPESEAFTRVISVPKMSGKELKTAMQWEAEQYIPIPLEDVSLDYQVIGEAGEADKTDVLLVAAPLTLTKKYLKILGDAGLETIGLETETLATSRSLVGPDSQRPTTLVANIGAGTTDISIVSGGFIRFTRSISTGGEAFARAVSQELNFEISQAREYMRSYGLEESQLEGKVMKAIKPVFDVVVSEIKRSIAYHATHCKDDSIKRVIVSGGAADLPGVLVYLAAALNLEVQLADPWEGLLIPEKFGRKELEDMGPRFAVAVGLALKDV
jgi:type IV pilus assembly protein PilM